jgi:hypothetical protein
LGDLLAVTNDHIRPPIYVQNRRNEYTFDTYAFTINLVPLVLDKHVLQDKYSNTSGKPTKRRNSKSIKQKCAKEINREAHLHDKSGPSTDMGGAQAHPGTDHAKVVMRRPHQGVAAPAAPL